ncbi:hypothetical protein C8J57DRAFT_1253021 [Mycena rebaudengoi]|nr:hypothetical protein C8J57DRAFT_1253021 [Mycena rebaudengoi]
MFKVTFGRVVPFGVHLDMGLPSCSHSSFPYRQEIFVLTTQNIGLRSGSGRGSDPIRPRSKGQMGQTFLTPGPAPDNTDDTGSSHEKRGHVDRHQGGAADSFLGQSQNSDPPEARIYRTRPADQARHIPIYVPPLASKAALAIWNVPRVGSKHTPTDREYLDSPSARQLMDLRDYVRGFRGMHPPTYSDAPSQLFFATYIARNASKFLDHEWVDIARVSRATTKFRIV